MNTGARDQQATGEGEASAFTEVFANLTAKQQEVLVLVAENHTSKEIAYLLGVSESAVNQRLETIRSRAGFPPRAELARAFRQHMREEQGYKNLTDEILQVPAEEGSSHQPPRDDLADAFVLADPLTFEVAAPWQRTDAERLVPGVLEGPSAGMNRVLAMIAIAVGLLMVAMIGLGVAQALTTVF